MSDVEFLDFGNAGDRQDVRVGESVSGVDGQADPRRVLRGPLHLGERTATVVVPPMSVSAGVQLDRRDTKILGLIDDGDIRIDEECHVDPGRVEATERGAKVRVTPRQVEATLGGHFLATFGDDGHLIGTQSAGEVDDVFSGRQLEVADRGHRRRDPLDVMILDVAPIFPEVDRDPVRAVRFGLRRRPPWVRFVGPPRLPEGRHMIHVDIEPKRSHSRLPGYTFHQSFPHEVSMRAIIAPAVVLLALTVGSSAAAQSQKAGTASQAVEEYIRAASDSNLVRMGQLFGTDKGSLIGRRVEGTDKRMMIIQAYLHGVKVRALSEVRGAKDNERVVTTEIARGSCKVVLPVTAVESGKEGWLVRNLDLDAASKVNQACSSGGRPGN